MTFFTHAFPALVTVTVVQVGTGPPALIDAFSWSKVEILVVSQISGAKGLPSWLTSTAAGKSLAALKFYIALPRLHLQTKHTFACGIYQKYT